MKTIYSDLRKSGIALVGDLPWGTHICQFYQTERDLLDILIPYFKAGLENNEFCLWITSGPLNTKKARQAIKKSVPRFEEYAKKNQIEIISGRLWSAGDGNSGKAVISKLDQAIFSGFDGLRLAVSILPGKEGETTAIWEGIDAFSRYNVIGIFAYPRDEFNAISLMEMVKNHRFALVRNADNWEIIESSEAWIAKEALKRSEEKLHSLFSNMSEGFAYHRVVLDAEGKPCDYIFLETNESFEKLTGLDGNQIIGRRVSEILPGIEKDPTDWIGRYGEVAVTGKPVQFESYSQNLEKWYAVSAFSPHKGYFAVTFTDISERKQMEAALRKSEQRWATTLSSIGDAVIATDIEGRITFMNSVAEDLTGWRLPEALSKPATGIFNIVNEHTRLKVECPVARVIQEGKVVGLANHTILIRKDGTEIPVDDSGAPIKDRDGNMIGIVLVFRDITERKRIDSELQRIAEQRQLALDAANMGWWHYDPITRVASWDERYKEIFGVTGYQRPNDEIFAHLNPQDLPGVWAKVESALDPANPQPYSAEYRINLPDGSMRWVEAHGTASFKGVGENRKATSFVGTVADINERKKGEEELLRLNRTLKALNDSNQTMTRAVNEAEYLDSVCRIIVEDCGHSMVWIGFAEDDKDKTVRPIACAGFEEGYLETLHITWADTERGRGPTGTAIRAGKPSICRDMLTDPFFEPWRENALKRGYASSVVLPLIINDKTVGALNIYSKEIDPFSEDEIDLLVRVADNVAYGLTAIRLRNDKARAEEDLHKAYDELEIRVQERTAELSKAYEALQREMEKREQVEDRLRQSQKMEALGTLTGGIAHDFNNILAAIIGFTEMAADDLPKDALSAHSLQRSLQAGFRGRELIKQMLTFSRKTETEKKPLKLSSLINETTKLLRASIPTTISIRVHIDSESGLVLADPTQIQQVLMNLCTNAAYAMRDQGGVLDVELTECKPLSGEVPDIKPGLYMKLTVKDTGTGIPPELLDKIFDPFFTTKQRGEGTGLGLSVVYGIIHQHAGHIVVESEPGQGTAFNVYFPKIDDKSPEEAGVDEVIPTGHECILFVDDEELLVELGQGMLERLGYEVVSKTSSREALSLFRDDPSRFDLVITDQTMPDMTGVILAQELLTLKPGLPIILCTGFSHLVDVNSALKAGVKAFVMKPLSKGEIAKTIRKVLDE